MDLPQLVEMVRLDLQAAGAAAAAAISITELRAALFPLVALDCLGAMAERERACVREVRRKKTKWEQKE